MSPPDPKNQPNKPAENELSVRHIKQINRRNTITKVKPSGKVYNRKQAKTTTAELSTE